MVMDENGRNGRKWHLAQQITETVMPYIFLQTTQPHSIHNNIQATIHTPCNSIITHI